MTSDWAETCSSNTLDLYSEDTQNLTDVTSYPGLKFSCFPQSLQINIRIKPWNRLIQPPSKSLHTALLNNIRICQLTPGFQSNASKLSHKTSTHIQTTPMVHSLIAKSFNQGCRFQVLTAGMSHHSTPLKRLLFIFIFIQECFTALRVANIIWTCRCPTTL
jgi:hypothetical protein